MYQAATARNLYQTPGLTKPVRVPMSTTERWFHVITVVSQFGGILPMYQYMIGEGSLEIGESSPVNTLMTATILIVCVSLGLKYRENILRAWPGLIPVAILLSYAMLSATWSDYPDITIRRAGTAITTAIWGAYLASRFSLRDIIILVCQGIIIIAILSFFAAILFPDLGVNELLESDPGGVPGWRGIVGDKNTFGIVMTTGAVSMIYLVISPGISRRDRTLWLMGAAFCTILLYLSASRTGWIAAAMGFACCGVVRVMYRRPTIGLVIWTGLLLIALPAMIFIVNDLGLLTSIVGKDATLTGRVDLWEEVLPWADKRPWLGYGYGAFWIEDSPITQSIWLGLNSYHPPHAHNGWIEAYLEIGLVGCFIVAIQMVQMIASGTRAVNAGRDVDAPYILLIAAVMLIFNMVESDLIRAPALFWPFLIMFPVAVSKMASNAKRAKIAARADAMPPAFRAALQPAPPILARRPVVRRAVPAIGRNSHRT